MTRQEIHCHGCGRFVHFNMDFGRDGDYSIACPNCGHMHYRTVRGGRITSERWRSSAQFTTIYGAYCTYTGTTSSDTGTTSASYYSVTATGTWS